MHVKSVKSPTQVAQNLAYRLVGLQTSCTLLISASWLFASLKASGSALLGGLACVIPSFYFAKRLFKTTHPLAVKKIIKTFYMGEVVKLLFSMILIALFVWYFPISLWAFISGFMAAQLGFLFAPFFIKFTPPSPKTS